MMHSFIFFHLFKNTIMPTLYSTLYVFQQKRWLQLTILLRKITELTLVLFCTLPRAVKAHTFTQPLIPLTWHLLNFGYNQPCLTPPQQRNSKALPCPQANVKNWYPMTTTPKVNHKTQSLPLLVSLLRSLPPWLMDILDLWDPPQCSTRYVVLLLPGATSHTPLHSC